MNNPQSAFRNPQLIEIHIEELVLHGFVPCERYRIADAVERELARLFAKQGVPPSFTYNTEATQMDAEVFNVASSSKAEAIGTQVAQAVYGGLSR